MGKVTDHGWSTSSDEIPQPASILLGANLRKNSNEASKNQREEPREKEAPPKKIISGSGLTSRRCSLKFAHVRACSLRAHSAGEWVS